MKYRNFFTLIWFIPGILLGRSWFPEQESGESYRLLECEGIAEEICGASLQGLVARAVNEGKTDEMLLIAPGSGEQRDWIKRTEERTGMQYRGVISLKNAIERYRTLCSGYVLYTADESEGPPYRIREGLDRSSNLATMMAGQLSAIPITIDLEPMMRQAGMKKLFDTHKSTFNDIIQNIQLNSLLACSLDPRTSNLRDMAVAHQMGIFFGKDESDLMFKKMTAPFMLLGWGAGDEFKHVAPATRQGGIQTVSNWTRNLTFLSADAGEYQPRKVQRMDPRYIDWKDERRTISFMLSDGDNTGWMLNNFWKKSYYGSENTGRVPMGFSAAMAQLAEIAPVVIDRLAETQQKGISFIEFGGGYFYPDLFASERPHNRESILRQHAERLNKQMKKTGTGLLCFIVNDSSSEDAKVAYRIFAEEIEPLIGMLVMDYAPYHKGEGRVYWATNSRGIQIPAVTARFCMWKGMNRPNAGEPDTIAELVNNDTEQNSWTSVHAWSRFGTEQIQAVDAVTECAGNLSEDIHVVNPEEMIWRIRMAHNADQTYKVINDLAN